MKTCWSDMQYWATFQIDGQAKKSFVSSIIESSHRSQLSLKEAAWLAGILLWVSHFVYSHCSCWLLTLIQFGRSGDEYGVCLSFSYCNDSLSPYHAKGSSSNWQSCWSWSGSNIRRQAPFAIYTGGRKRSVTLVAGRPDGYARQILCYDKKPHSCT